MQVFDNDISIARNESFVYDRFVQNKDGSPYIISSQMSSPMLRFTVAADEYHVSDDRYVLNRYLSLKDAITNDILPKFYCTNPICLMKSATERATDFEDNIPGDEFNPIPDINGVNRYNYAVYYIVDPVSSKITYKRYAQIDENSGEWRDYSFRIVLPFGVDITNEWVARNYTYDIYMMDGTSYVSVMVDEVARILAEELNIPFVSAHEQSELMTEQQLYDKILEYNNKDGHVTDVAMIDDKEVVIDMSDDRWSPYWQVDCDIPLLKSAKISVKSDAIGGL